MPGLITYYVLKACHWVKVTTSLQVWARLPHASKPVACKVGAGLAGLLVASIPSAPSPSSPSGIAPGPDADLTEWVAGGGRVWDSGQDSWFRPILAFPSPLAPGYGAGVMAEPAPIQEVALPAEDCCGDQLGFLPGGNTAGPAPDSGDAPGTSEPPVAVKEPHSLMTLAGALAWILLRRRSGASRATHGS
jgi:hypothetical protein